MTGQPLRIPTLMPGLAEANFEISSSDPSLSTAYWNPGKGLGGESSVSHLGLSGWGPYIVVLPKYRKCFAPRPPSRQGVGRTPRLIFRMASSSRPGSRTNARWTTASGSNSHNRSSRQWRTSCLTKVTESG